MAANELPGMNIEDKLDLATLILFRETLLKILPKRPDDVADVVVVGQTWDTCRRITRTLQFHFRPHR